MTAASAQFEIPISPESLYTISEVSRLTATKPFVLRFWEKEFPMLQPVKNDRGQRLYRREDVRDHPAHQAPALR